MNSIYEAAQDSFLLQSHVREGAFGRVLDMGTGSGIQALTAIANPNVKEVVAVDINPEAVELLQQKLKQEKIRKISIIKSDLFENVQGQFNTIIFNPPYLPQDKGIEDAALYGGKKGWELSARFFAQASSFLFADGKILFLFSSLTNKKKIDEILQHHLLESVELERQKLPFFEELYLYEIHKSKLLRNLEKKGITHIHHFSQGRRGVLYCGQLDRNSLVKSHFPPKKDIITVAIKVEREGSEALERMGNEAKWLQILNRKGIGPRYLFQDEIVHDKVHDEKYVGYEFVEGKEIIDWMPTASKGDIALVLKRVLEQCLALDSLGVNKEEMHHPTKHIIIDKFNNPTLIDFERCSHSEHPKNVTQFVEFICRLGSELDKKGFHLRIDELRELAKEYKETRSAEILKSIINSVC